MPKKAVAIFFLAALIGAALFVFFTFPRTKEQIPTSNNQRPFPSAPTPGPNGVPIPETVPHPDAPKVPPGPKLRVMAWASATEAKALEAQADAFTTATGREASLTIDRDPVSYRRDLQQALASETPPDVCLISSRDFSGLDPARDLISATPNPGTAPRSMAAFTVDGQIRAVPAEFAVDVLFYNPAYFDQAGIGYPDRHWTWDVLEAITRAMASLKLKDDSGQPVYPLELPSDFDLWNLLCTQAGHPALDQNGWHLAESGTRDAQMRALDLIREFFQELAVTAPLPKTGEAPGHLFAQQRAALLIAPSDFTASLPSFPYAFTLLPGDLTRASLARVNGWAVTTQSSQPEAARALADYLAWQPVHAGWSSVQKPAVGDTSGNLLSEILGQALIPRVGTQDQALAQFLDQQINLLARTSGQTTDALYTRIQTEYHGRMSAPEIESVMPQAAGLKPVLLTPTTAPLRKL